MARLPGSGRTMSARGSRVSLAAASSREYEPLAMPHIARRAYDAASGVIRRLFCFSRCSVRKIRKRASVDFLRGLMSIVRLGQIPSGTRNVGLIKQVSEAHQIQSQT